jgi:hypothetical protein
MFFLLSHFGIREAEGTPADSLIGRIRTCTYCTVPQGPPATYCTVTTVLLLARARVTVVLGVPVGAESTHTF